MPKQLKSSPRASIQKNSIESQLWLYCLIFSVILVISVFLSAQYGPMDITISKIMDIILFKLGLTDNIYWSKTEQLVIWNLRLPRSILACLAGAGLAISGVAMQASVKNPLADPYILGISAGASAGATAVIAADLLDITAEYSISIGAFCGAVGSVLLLFMLNKSNRDSVRLLLSGCVISILFLPSPALLCLWLRTKKK